MRSPAYHCDDWRVYAERGRFVLADMGSSFPTSTRSSALTTCCRRSAARRASTRRSSSCRCVRVASRPQLLIPDQAPDRLSFRGRRSTEQQKASLNNFLGSGCRSLAGRKAWARALASSRQTKRRRRSASWVSSVRACWKSTRSSSSRRSVLERQKQVDLRSAARRYCLRAHVFKSLKQPKQACSFIAQVYTTSCAPARAAMTTSPSRRSMQTQTKQSSN